MGKTTIQYTPAQIAIRTDGGSKQGLGHIVRQLVLARTLRARFGWNPAFITATVQPLISLFRHADEFQVVTIPADDCTDTATAHGSASQSVAEPQNSMSRHKGTKHAEACQPCATYKHPAGTAAPCDSRSKPTVCDGEYAQSRQPSQALSHDTACTTGSNAAPQTKPALASALCAGSRNGKAAAYTATTVAEAASMLGAALVLFDTCTPVSAATVQAVQAAGAKVWLYGNTGEGMHKADRCIFTFPQIAQHIVENYAALPVPDGKAGSDYAIMDDVFRTLRDQRRPEASSAGAGNKPFRLFVSMGGADKPFTTGLVAQALMALPEHLSATLHVHFVGGPAFAHSDALHALLHDAPFSWQLHSAPPHFAHLAASCDLAITQMGNTAAELNCLGVPVALLNSSSFHSHIADLYCSYSGGANLGLAQDYSPQTLAQSLCSWLTDSPALSSLAERGKSAIDGCGAIRVADALFNALQDGFSLWSCDVCGADSHTTQALSGGRPIVRCRECGLEYMNVRPSAERLAQVYAAEYFTAPRTQNDVTSYEADKPNVVRFARARLEALEQWLPDKGHLLDVGCALGFYLQEAQQRGWQVTGMDISDYAIEFARQRLGIANVHKGTVESLDFPDGSFDAIICSLVFEHFLDPRACLEKMTSWLRPGGYIAIKVPHGNGLMRQYTPDNWFATHPDNHFCDYTPQTLGRMLQATGLWPEHWLTEGIYAERLANAMQLDEAQKAAFMNIEGMAESWHKLAASRLLGDSLVMYGKKL